MTRLLYILCLLLLPGATFAIPPHVAQQFLSSSYATADSTLELEYLFATDASDTSGNNYDGTLQADAAIVSGRLELDGTGDFVETDTTDEFDAISEGTVAGWVKIEDLNGGNQLFFTYSDDADNDSYWTFGFHDSSDSIYVGLREGAASQDFNMRANGTLTTNWHHVGVICTPGNTRFFIDGIEQEETILADDGGTASEGDMFAGIASEAERATFGAFGRVAAANFLMGDMDSWRVYSEGITSNAMYDLFLEGHD